MNINPTKHRLLEAAGEVFAEAGFKNATIRDICERAGANIAAINYHFGDKERLYAEVFKYVNEVDCGYQVAIAQSNPALDPVGALKMFIESMVKKMLLPGKFSWKGTLMAREMADPSPVLDEIVRSWIKPYSDLLNIIVSNLINLPINHDLVRLCSGSVFGQCFFHKHGMAVNLKLYPDLTYNEAEIEKLALHIFEFSLGGIEKIKAFQS